MAKYEAIDYTDNYLLIDGYNLMYQLDECGEMAKKDLATARDLLCEILCNYQGYKKENVILVFDAYKVPQGKGSIEDYKNIKVVYTKESETADSFIEKATYDIGRKHKVRVVTSDGSEQIIVMGHGCVRMTAKEFKEELLRSGNEIHNHVFYYNKVVRRYGLEEAYKKALQIQGGKRND